jgi:hypothetical protein
MPGWSAMMPNGDDMRGLVEVNPPNGSDGPLMVGCDMYQNAGIVVICDARW